MPDTLRVSVVSSLAFNILPLQQLLGLLLINTAADFAARRSATACVVKHTSVSFDSVGLMFVVCSVTSSMVYYRVPLLSQSM